MPKLLSSNRYREFIEAESKLNDRIVNMYNYKTRQKKEPQGDNYVHKEGDIYGPDLTCNSIAHPPYSIAMLENNDRF